LKMATLVTGGTGFVGSNIVRALAEGGHRVVSLDIAPPDDMVLKHLKPWGDRITWLEGDVLDREGMVNATATEGIDKIVHAAAYTGTRQDIKNADSHRFLDINIGGTINLLELARRLSVTRFLFVSSSGVYAGGIRYPDDALREEMRIFPNSLYAITKQTGEQMTERYGHLHGFETVSVRLASPYGPMERVTGHRGVMCLVYDWTRSAVRGEAIDMSRVIDDRDFIYVLDLATAIQKVLDAPALKHDVYNIGCGHRVTPGEMVAAIRQVCPGVTFKGDAPALPSVGLVYGRGPLDMGRLKELGYAPDHDFIAGLKEYMAWREEFPFKD
jgi:UDP-glucose 4-epimerase